MKGRDLQKIRFKTSHFFLCFSAIAFSIRVVSRSVSLKLNITYMIGGVLYNSSIIGHFVGNKSCSSLCTVVHQYSLSNCCSETRRPENWLCDKRHTQKKRIFSLVCVFSHLGSFFSYWFLHSSSYLLPFSVFLQYFSSHTHAAYTSHINTYGPPPSQHYLRHHPHNTFYFSSVTWTFIIFECLHLSLQPSPFPLVSLLYSLVLPLSQPSLMCGCNRRCFDLTLDLFSTSTAAGGPVGSLGVGICW